MSVDTEQVAASGSRAVSKMQSYHKSCLRQRQRRLSDTTLGGGGGLPKNDSMDDCSSYSYSSSMSDDGGGAESGSSSSSRFSSCDGLLSRKSVSFADSVGEDLCHVKVFSKELCEYDDEQEESWPSKLWRWQMFPTSEESEWYVGDDDENDQDSRFDLNDLAMISEAADHLEDVQEEDEDEYEAADEDEESGTTHGDWDAPKNSRFHVERATSSDDDLGRRPQAASSPSSPSNSVIVPTFLCPVDLPSFPERLAERGVSLEVVCVGDGGRITGSVALADDVGGEFCPIRRVCVRFSSDGWASEPREAPTTAVADSSGVHYEFEIEAGGMEVGDDVEMVAVCVMDTDTEEERVDDNRGLRYRFICKNRPKFQPGKSLW